MDTQNYVRFLTQEEKILIRHEFYRNMTGLHKIKFYDLYERTNIPAFFIKQYLMDILANEILRRNIKMFDKRLYSICNGYIALQHAKYKDSNKIYLHSYIVSKLLKIDHEDFTQAGYISHHINQNKLDNRLNNIIPMPRYLHTQYHQALKRTGEKLDIYWYIEEYNTNIEYKILLNRYLTNIKKLAKTGVL